MKKNRIKLRTTLLISLIIVLIDQATKYLARDLLENSSAKVFIPRIIHLQLVHNTGAAFSIFRDNAIILGILSIIVSGIILKWIINSSPLKLINALGGSFLMAGSIGNGIDRLLLGSVTDFIAFSFVEFPIFNIADISINIGIIFFLIDTLNELKIKKHRSST